jgi:hypothetical protein
MNDTCICGNPADGNGTRCSRCMALRILDLEMDATEEQIRDTYRTMVKVWHPDRFQSDKSLRDSAEAKLKDINTAFKYLSSTPAGSRPRPHGKPTPVERYQAPREDPNDSRSSRDAAIQFAQSSTSPSRSILPAFKTLFKFVGLLLVILLCRYTWIAFNGPEPSTAAIASAYSVGKDTVLSRLEEPKRKFIEAVERDLVRVGFLNSMPVPPHSQQAPGTESQTQQKTPGKAIARLRSGTGTTSRTIYSLITVGSTESEVIEQLGNPTAASEDKLAYGKSELYLKDGAVIGWNIDPVSNPIHVKLWPQAPVDTSQEYFTLDSSKDDVLVIQGTPTAFSKDKFMYGSSEIDFQNDRVTHWKNDPASISLRARMP